MIRFRLTQKQRYTIPFLNTRWQQIASLLLFIGLFCSSVAAQEKKVQKEQQGQQEQKEQQVKFKAEYLEGVVIDEEQCQKLIGNVFFTLEEMTIEADEAIYYSKQKRIEAQGNVRIVHKDGAKMWADRLIYDEESQLAQLRDKVVFQSEDTTFHTDHFDYNVDTQEGNFQGEGKLIHEGNTLTSQSGYYNDVSKAATFRRSVTLANEDYALKCDTLYYNTVTKIAQFRGHTEITSQDGEHTLTTEHGGEYNTKSQQSTFQQSHLETQDYMLYGERICADKAQEVYTATGNVRLVAKKEDLTISGNYGHYRQKEGVATLYGNALMTKILDGDPLYLSADTFVATENQQTKNSDDAVVRAYHNVKIYKEDLQGKADTMVYQGAESTLYFEGDPVFWSFENQLTAEKAHILIKDQAFHEMHMQTNGFVASKDEFGHYNQLKGRNMVAHFKENKIDHIIIEGNAESVYFVIHEKDFKGMNHLRCGQMRIKMEEDTIANILFKPQPKGVFYPAHLIEEKQKQLSNFTWRAEERPTKRDVVEHGYGTHQEYKEFKFNEKP